MNERIRELAEQSGMTQYVAAHNKYLERFAELIVRECAELFPGQNMYGGLAIQSMIKDHFGVDK